MLLPVATAEAATIGKDGIEVLSASKHRHVLASESDDAVYVDEEMWQAGESLHWNDCQLDVAQGNGTAIRESPSANTPERSKCQYRFRRPSSMSSLSVNSPSQSL